MNRTMLASLAAVLGLSAVAQAGPLCGLGVHCMEPGQTCCKPNDCPCDGLRLGYGLLGPDVTRRLLDDLCNGDSCDRVRAARLLGRRLFADFCDCPEVLTALAHALTCDTCWAVRRAAALAIAGQDARTDYGVLVLYVASKLDHHYLVRDAATNALAFLLLCRTDYYACLFKDADVLIKKIRPQYNPTKCQCVDLLDAFCAEHGIVPGAMVPHGAVVKGGPVVAGSTVVPPGAVVLEPALVPPGSAPVATTPTVKMPAVPVSRYTNIK